MRYSEADWREIIPDMSKRAKLNAPEREQLAAYVLASRKAGG
jgi:hypothetical protein